MGKLSHIDVGLLIAAIDALYDGVVITDAERRIVAVNDAICRMTGYRREELIGSTWELVEGPATQGGVKTAMELAVSRGETFVGELLNYRKDGTPFWNGLSLAPVIRDGQTTHYVSMQRDITDFVAERAASENEHTTTAMLLSVARALSGRTAGPDVAQIIADAVPAVWGSDRATVLLWDDTNDCYVMAATSGWEGSVGDDVKAWEGTRENSPDLTRIMETKRPALLDRTSPWARELMDRFGFAGLVVAPVIASGHFLGFVSGQWSSTPPPVTLDHTLTDRILGIAGLAGVALDQTRLQEAIAWSVTHDPVTGLPNQRMLEDHIVAELEDLGTHGGHDVTLLACDVDRFSRVSSTYPVAVVDSTLREIASRLTSAMGPDTFVARLPGDAFMIVLRCSPEDAERAAGRAIEAFLPGFAIGDELVQMGIHLGGVSSATPDLAGSSSPRTTSHRLISLALADLEERRAVLAKTPSSQDPDASRLDTELRNAVANGEITVHYQPQVRLADGGLAGVEALVRWKHPQLGDISPVRFIPLAEYNGTIREIGRYVLETACRDAARWREHGHPIEVSVNVAVHQLDEPGFADRVSRTVAAAGIEPHQLTIEVTETRLVTDRSLAQAQLRQLRANGHHISIDDFGTGFSSLTQLSNMPVGELKVDRSFVVDVEGVGRQVVAGVIGFARGLNLRVVAEGVETEEQYAVLQELGCDRAQGYLIARPMPVGDLERDWLGLPR